MYQHRPHHRTARPAQRAPLTVYAALLATLAIASIGGVATAAESSGSGTDHAAHRAARVCFPASAWSADQGERPCVRVTNVEEDGSFGYAVTDADGTVRYTAGIGALDR